MQRVLTAWQGRKIPVGWKRLQKHGVGALLLGLSGVWLLRSYKTSPPHPLAEDKCKSTDCRSMQMAFRWCFGFALALTHGWILLWLPRATREPGIMNKLALDSLKCRWRFPVRLINAIKMIMFISMYLLKIIQLVTVQWLLMFHFWAAEQMHCSTADLALTMYRPWQQPSRGWVGGVLQAVFIRAATCRKTLFLQDLPWNMVIPEIDFFKKKKEYIKVMMSPEKRFPCQGVFVW